jgi:hypothetical protein
MLLRSRAKLKRKSCRVHSVAHVDTVLALHCFDTPELSRNCRLLDLAQDGVGMAGVDAAAHDEQPVQPLW